MAYLNAKAQKNIYFVSGDTEENKEYPKGACVNTILWQLQNGKLIVKDTIGYNNDDLHSIKHYKDEKLLVGVMKSFLLSEHIERVDKIRLFEINYAGKTFKKDTLILEIATPPADTTNEDAFLHWEEPHLYNTPLLKSTKDSLKLIFEFYNGMDNKNDRPFLKYYFVDLKTFKKTPASVRDFTTSQLVGNQGAGTYEQNMFYFYLRNGGKIELPITYDWAKRPILPFRIPNEIGLKIDSSYALLINTNKVFMVWADDMTEKYEKGKFTNSSINVLNKSNNIWKSFKFNTSGADFRTYNHYLVGEQYQSYKVLNDNSWISPGKEKRRENVLFDHSKKINKSQPSYYINVTGKPFDSRTQVVGRYFLGKLFVINTQTWQKYEWETQQGDSEILLVDEETVYYRVYDSIFKRKLYKSSLGIEEFIVKQERNVPDIHWMFIAE